MQSWVEQELGALVGGQRLAAQPGMDPALSRAPGSLAAVPFTGPDDTGGTRSSSKNSTPRTVSTGLSFRVL